MSPAGCASAELGNLLVHRTHQRFVSSLALEPVLHATDHMALHRFVLTKDPGRAKLPSLAVRYYRGHPRSREETRMATPERRSGIGGISVGGIIVVVGILTMIFWSIVLGLDHHAGRSHRVWWVRARPADRAEPRPATAAPPWSPTASASAGRLFAERSTRSSTRSTAQASRQSRSSASAAAASVRTT